MEQKNNPLQGHFDNCPGARIQSVAFLSAQSFP